MSRNRDQEIIPQAEGDGGERERLKELLLGEERERVEKLEHTLDEPDEHSRLLSRDLPRAIRARTSQDNKLSKALSPAVEDILHDSVRRDPRTMADALYPVMGPSIRRSIAEALRAMVQSLNDVLSSSFSWQGLKWRLEAMRTRKPFAEVVLLHSLVYRVEQAFLIHKKTGLLLQHLTAEAVEHMDPDMVSAMLTAIQDFVRDSFSMQDEGLDSLRLGQLDVIIEQGPDAVLALVVRGRAPADLNQAAQEALETIQIDYKRELHEFNGDASVFERARPLIQDCMRAGYRKKTKSRAYALAVALLVLGLLAAFLVWRGFRESRWEALLESLEQEPGIVVLESGKQDGRRFAAGLRDPLARKPAEVLAESPVADWDVDLRFTPYQSMSPAFILEHARKSLEPPPGVDLSQKDGVLFATGEAPWAWVRDARKIAPVLPGVARYDDSGLAPDYSDELAWYRRALAAPGSVELDFDNGVLTASGSASYRWITSALVEALRLPGVTEYRDKELRIDYADSLRRFKEALPPPDTLTLSLEDGLLAADGEAPHAWIAKARETVADFPEISQLYEHDLADIDWERFRSVQDEVEKTRVLFLVGKATISPGQEKTLEKLAADVLLLQNLARELDADFQLRIYGHTDTSGGVDYNKALSEQRALAMRDLFARAGADPALILHGGLGSADPVAKGGEESQRQLNRRVEFLVTAVPRNPNDAGQ